MFLATLSVSGLCASAEDSARVASAKNQTAQKIWHFYDNFNSGQRSILKEYFVLQELDDIEDPVAPWPASDNEKDDDSEDSEYEE
jgi:DNA-binding PucR family transcriptional regulator